MPAELRCPGPLIALRCLAALYGIPAQQLAELLPACATVAPPDPESPAVTLATAVAGALGSLPRTPTAVHYFAAAWLADPESVLELGLPAPADAGPARRAWLVRDGVIRPGLYGLRDQLATPSPGGAPLTPCIVEYRRRGACTGDDLTAALWFVAAALRGAVSPPAAAGLDTDASPVDPQDIVSIREPATQAEWTRDPRRR